MVKGDQYWLVENGLNIVSVEVLSVSGNLVLIKTQNGKTLRLPKHRLYDSEENAMKVIRKNKAIQKKKTPYDDMM